MTTETTTPAPRKCMYCGEADAELQEFPAPKPFPNAPEQKEQMHLRCHTIVQSLRAFQLIFDTMGQVGYRIIDRALALALDQNFQGWLELKIVDEHVAWRRRFSTTLKVELVGLQEEARPSWTRVPINRVIIDAVHRSLNAGEVPEKPADHVVEIDASKQLESPEVQP